MVLFSVAACWIRAQLLSAPLSLTGSQTSCSFVTLSLLLLQLVARFLFYWWASGQRSLACCDSGGHTESDTAQLLNGSNLPHFQFYLCSFGKPFPLSTSPSLRRSLTILCQVLFFLHLCRLWSLTVCIALSQCAYFEMLCKCITLIPGRFVIFPSRQRLLVIYLFYYFCYFQQWLLWFVHFSVSSTNSLLFEICKYFRCQTFCFFSVVRKAVLVFWIGERSNYHILARPK